MKYWLVVLAVVATGTLTSALPVKEKKHEKEAEVKEEGEHNDDWELNLEYGRYLKEVVQALESDSNFRKKLEAAQVDDIKSGKIARELHFVDHNVRTKLDELKRRELERLRHLAVKEHEKKTGVDRALLKMPVHIDHRNPTRFEVEDLKKLIVKTTEDLEKVDQQRRMDFKTYEMEKEYQRKQDLSGMDEDHRKVAETKHGQEMKKHSDHPKLHHPGSKQQLEEVWEEQDRMQPEDFDPNTFFHLHDLDGNGYWDETEVKALFKKELDKMYDPNDPDDDINERFEEMERMREHVFNESDTNHDNLISFREFVEQTKRVEFEQDGGWAGLDEQEIYSQQEYERYEQQRAEEIQHLVETGQIPPPPGYHGMPPVQAAMFQGGPHPGLATPQHHISPELHSNALPQGNQAAPLSYQAVPQSHQAIPQGYQAVPQGYQAVPQGYQAAPQEYQAAPQGFQQVQYHPQGQPVHQDGQPGQPAQVYPGQGQFAQGQPQGYPQAPQGQLQGHPQAPQGQLQGHPQAPQGQLQGHPQAPLQGHPQAPLQGHPQAPLQGHLQAPLQGHPQVPQGQLQGQPPPVQGQPPQVAQGHPPQAAQVQQSQVLQGQQVPISGNIPQPPQLITGQAGAGH